MGLGAKSDGPPPPLCMCVCLFLLLTLLELEGHLPYRDEHLLGSLPLFGAFLTLAFVKTTKTMFLLHTMTSKFIQLACMLSKTVT